MGLAHCKGPPPHPVARQGSAGHTAPTILGPGGRGRLCGRDFQTGLGLRNVELRSKADGERVDEGHGAGCGQSWPPVAG